MNVLHILKTDPGEGVQTIIDEHRKSHTVEVLNLTECKDYDRIVTLIESCDRVFTW